MAEEKRKTKTSTAVKTRYNEKVYDVISARVPKELAAAFKEKCAADGNRPSLSIYGGLYDGRADI